MDQSETQFIDKLRQLGGSAGNISMMRELKWDKDSYWPIRDSLLDKGVITRAKGKGGSVHLLVPSTETLVERDEAVVEEADIARREMELYGPMAAVLQRDWARDKRFHSHEVEITARQGRRETGGTWTRPDITVLTMSMFPYVPGKHFDVITFEVKPYSALDVSCVYEALAHRRAATRSYVLLHVPEDHQDEEWVKSALGEIEEEAKRHGVGVIVAGKPDTYETWEESVVAQRQEPAPERLNEFLSVQVSQRVKERIITWFR